MKVILSDRLRVKNWLMRGLTSIVGVVVIATLWLTYSLVSFDGFFSPVYAIGLSDPYRYHQRYVSDLLIQYGKEYKLDDVDTTDWKVYRDSEDSFEFKYPEKLDAEIVAKNETSDHIRLSNNSSKEKGECVVSAEFVGRGIGVKWLPRERRGVSLDIDNNRLEKLYYVRTIDGGVFKIESTRLTPKDEQNIHFTGITFIHQKTDKFVAVKDYGNKCSEDTIKGILATFQFTK